MKITAGMDCNGRAALVAAAAIFTLSFATTALAQHVGGRPAAAGNMRAMPVLPAQVPSSIWSHRPATLPEAAAASDNAATATTTIEHTEDGIVRTTTVTNKQGTMTSATAVSRDEDAGTQTVKSSSTGFDGKTRNVENAVTKTEDGADHTLTKEGDEDADAAGISSPAR
ncbi:MAG: hypothetical protein WBO00_00440 [Steroidobacteraceae bacterium]